MNKRILSRGSLVLLVMTCLFGDLFPFLSIDLSFVEFKPFYFALIIVGCYCLFEWIRRLANRELMNEIKRDWRSWSVFLFFAIWFVLGFLWLVLGNTNSYALTEVAGVLIICIMAFCIFTLVKDTEDISFLLKLCVWCGAILAILALFELVFGSFLPISRFYFSLDQKIEMGKTMFAPTTVFYNPNDFAAFMLLCISIVCYWIIRSQNLKEYLRYLGIALLLVIPTSMTDSTIFNLTVWLLIFVTSLALLLNRKNSFKFRALCAAILVAVSLFCGCFAIGFIRNAATKLNSWYYTVRIENYLKSDKPSQGSGNKKPGSHGALHSPGIGLDGDVSGELGIDIESGNNAAHDSLKGQLGASANGYGTVHTRIWLIRAGWDFFLDNPVFGNGPESFRDMMAANKYYLEKAAGIVNPHFFYTELLSQYGGIIFAIYIIIVVLVGGASLLLAARELLSGKIGPGLITLFLIVVFSIAVVMPSSTIRKTYLWLFLLIAFCTFFKGRSKKTELINKD